MTPAARAHENPGRFSGIVLKARGAAPSGRLASLLTADPCTPPCSPAPGAFLPGGAAAVSLRGRPGSWLQLESPDVDARKAAELYLKYGRDFVRRLRGRFAFALHDRKENVFMLGSDYFSETTVYYAAFKGGIAWSESPDALSRLPGVDASIDPAAVDRYLTLRYVPSPFTMYAGVRKLPPASLAVWRNAELSVERYWNLPMNDGRYGSAEEAAEAVRDSLFEAARYRLRGVKDAAAAVSGGLDSSAAAVASAAAGVALTTFTAGTPEKDCDFSLPGRRIAKLLGSRHSYLEYGDPSASDLMEMSAAYDEPQSDQAAVPLWLLAGRIKTSGPVLISGDGGDESFAGYGRTRRMLDLVGFAKGGLLEDLRARAMAQGGKMPGELMARVRSATDNRLDTLYAELARVYLSDTSSFFPAGERKKLYSNGFASTADKDLKASALRIEDIFRGTFGQDWLRRIMLPDLFTFHPECSVRRLRVSAARAGLRLIPLFNDHKLVELAMGIPGKWKLPRKKDGGSVRKPMLRKAMSGLLPRGIRGAAKHGLDTPAGKWLSGPLKGLLREALLSRDSITAGFFRRARVAGLIKDHISGRRDRNGELWDLLMLELWLRTRTR